MQNIWTDPVWSKVIAAGIITLAGFMLRIFWNKLPISWKRKSPIEINPRGSVEIIEALMLIEVNPSMLESYFEDPTNYQSLIKQLSTDALITFNENNLPSLTKKGHKLVKKHRKLEEKMHD